jgi:dTDP-4-amino-4,6-dideoxygalactose transaminase
VVPPGREHVFHQYTVRLPGTGERDRVLGRLKARGVGARVYYTRPIHTEPAFAGRLGSLPALPETERACSEVLSLPVYPSLTESERAFVVEAFNAAVAR